MGTISVESVDVRFMVAGMPSMRKNALQLTIQVVTTTLAQRTKNTKIHPIHLNNKRNFGQVA